MEALSLKYSNTINKKLLSLFVCLELVVVVFIFLLGYKISLFLYPAIIFGVLNFWNVRAGLFGMIAFSVSVAYGVKSVTGPMLVILGITLIFVCLSVYFKFCLGKFKIIKTELNLPIAIFTGIVFFQVLRGFFNSYSPKWIYVESLAYLGFGMVFLVVNLCDSRAIIKKFFQLLVLLAYYQTIIGLLNYFRVGHRIGGHLFGAFPSLIALVLLNISLHSRDKSQKLLYLLISLPLILHLLFSFTRGYWLGFLVALFISTAIYIVNSQNTFSEKILAFLKSLFFYLVGIMMLLALVSYFLPVSDLHSKIAMRFLSSFSTTPGVQTVSNYARLVEYRTSWEEIKQKPILGQGVGYTLTVKQPILQSVGSQWFIHQSYLMIMLKMGLIGLLSFLWIFYVFFRIGLMGSKNLKDSYYQGMSFGFIANAIQLLVIAFTNYDFASVVNTFYLGFAMGGVIIITSTGDKVAKKALG